MKKEKTINEKLNINDSLSEDIIIKNADELLSEFEKLSKEKRDLVIKTLIDDTPNNYQRILSAKGNNNEDRVTLLIELLKRNNIYTYRVLNKISDPKKYLTKDEIKQVLDNISIEKIIRDYDAYFMDEIFERFDYYKLLEIKDKLTVDEIKMVFEKSFSDYNQYLKVITYLNEKEKKEYVSLFLDNNCTNIEIVQHVLIGKLYFDKDLERLIDIIIKYADARTIYNILMHCSLNIKSSNKLEKELLNTKNIEYIAYYYFYKNRKKFNELFGSGLLFLSFVMMNKNLFTDNILLSRVIDEIKYSDGKYVDNVSKKIEKERVLILQKK